MRTEIVRLLGVGGMGQVYLACRADGSFQRDVAIKLIDVRHEPLPDVFRRFEDERRILASLHHPNIAALLDAGRTTSGAMYFVMEYVDGRPITEHCERHALSLRARIELILQVCDAVSYAHRNLIVHRDIKPSNVLVDRDGNVKLLDFGIAKALTDAHLDPTPTDPRFKRVTPAYASPEHLSGQPTHTGMDVYALGIVLHEMLTGLRPKRPAADDPTGQAPPRVSQLLAQLPRDAGSQRAINPRDVSGDLDAVVAHALEPDWRDRYASVDDLASDLRSWIAGRPVLARDGGRIYRARKFARRNPAGTATAAVAIVSLVVAVAVLERLWTVTRAERDRAQTQLTAVRTLAGSLFEVDGKLSGVNGTTTSRRALMDAIGTYLAALELSTDPSVLLDTAHAYKRLGDVEGNPNESNLGDVARALSRYEQAVRILEKLRLVRDTAEVRESLATTLASRADVYNAKADLDQAEAEYQRALAVASPIASDNPAEPRYQLLLGGIYRPLGDIRLARGDVAGALAQDQRALALSDKSVDSLENKRLSAITHIRLGDARRAAGQQPQARQHYEVAARGLRQIVENVGDRRDLLRDAALGLARVGVAGRPADHAADDIREAVTIFRRLRLSDPADMRARHDLMVVLTEYGDAVVPSDPEAGRTALNEARQIARMASAEAPDDPERARELAAIERRLSGDVAGGRLSLQLVSPSDGGHSIAPGGEPLRLGNVLRVAAGAPAGWVRYVVLFGAEGPAEIFDERRMTEANWTLPVKGPPPAQTVLLLASPGALSSDQQHRADGCRQRGPGTEGD